MFTDRDDEDRVHKLMTFNPSNNKCRFFEYPVFNHQEAETVQCKDCLFIIYWEDLSVDKYTWKNKNYQSDKSLFREVYASECRARERCTATFVEDRQIAILGGRDAKAVVQNSLYWLDVSSGEFLNGPLLFQNRYSHSTCELIENLFTYGGLNNNEEPLSTVERLSSQDSWQDWKLIAIEGILPRLYTVFCPINDEELLIYGGYQDDSDNNPASLSLTLSL